MVTSWRKFQELLRIMDQHGIETLMKSHQVQDFDQRFHYGNTKRSVTLGDSHLSLF